MALSVLFTIRDRSGDKATTKVAVPSGLTLVQYTEFAAKMAKIINDATVGVIERADVCVDVDLSALVTNTADPDSDVEEAGYFGLEADTGETTTINIPALNQQIVDPTNDLIDLTDARVVAFSNQLLNGVTVTGGTIPIVDLSDEPLSVLFAARNNYRNSGKRRK